MTETDTPRPQLRLLTIGAAIGLAMLAASLVVDLTGANDPEMPKMPAIPGRTVPSGAPTNMPQLPTDMPQMPTGMPQLPTNMPQMPTNMPSMPPVPGGAP
ncbi:hypothetical protein E1293_02260 [Actinomadura darangshiensis]|uniref:Uncharacterized protein n=1 Tax=Actinomadura darangshiensis TaxID=705336 RepID=A0A4R5BW86_9ACTN|nr:hypothetical protein [Actinomadura darangshiensis]TDD91428.1 hypothetical protein E1293_02260 [Actinomadura darangshiensis]